MPTVRNTSNHRNVTETEWLGAPAVDSKGHIERALKMPDEAYRRIEEGIAKGFIEGKVALPDGVLFSWFLDR
jgi:hypothetical protein